MSLTPEAIKQIGQISHVPEFMKQLEEANTQSQLVLVPESMSIKDLESHQQYRNSYRGCFETPVIDEYVNYAKLYAVEGSKAFIDVESMASKAVFDLGSTEKAGHQRHKAKLQLRKTAPYKILLNRNNRPAEQREMSEWLDDNKEFLQAFSSDGEVIEITKAIEAIKTLSFEHKRGRESSVSDFAERQSEYEQIATKTKDELELPAVFIFTCEPYQGLPAFKFELRTSIKGADVVNLRIKNLEAMEEKIAQTFLELLRGKFEEQKITIDQFIGSWD